jgi:hypothetical protein
MYIFAMVMVGFVYLIWLYDFLMEDTGQLMKEVMEYERNVDPKRSNVIRGVFRKHHETFQHNGIKPPHGTA